MAELHWEHVMLHAIKRIRQIDHCAALARRRKMRERSEVGVAEAGDGLAHQRVGAGALAVAQLFQRRDQIVDALLRDARDLVGTGQCGLMAGAAAPCGRKPGCASAAVTPIASIATPAQPANIDRLIVRMSFLLSSSPHTRQTACSPHASPADRP